MTDTTTKPTPAMDPTLRRDAEALHAAVSRLTRIYQFRDRDRICCHDVSVTQCHALEALVDGGPMRSQTLAAELRLDKSTTTRVIDALVRKGYVERSRDPEDGRAVSLRATASGEELFRRIEAELIEHQAELVQDLVPEIRQAAAVVIERLAAAAATHVATSNEVGCVGNACACTTTTTAVPLVSARVF